MKLLKKCFCIFLAIMLLCSLLPQTALAAQPFSLGTDSAEMLYGGGCRVLTERGAYFIGEDGFVYLEEDGEVSLIAQMAAANLNYAGGTLYFTVQGNTSFALWSYDGECACLTEIAGRVKQLYIANGTTAYYSIGAAVWKLPLGGRAKLVYENEALFSFVPTQYGIVAALGTAAEYMLYAGENAIVDFCDRYSVDFDADGGRIYYHDYFGDHQLDLKDAFAGTASAEEYTGYGEVNVSEMLSQAYNADERELAYEAQTAQNAAAGSKRALNGAQASSTAIRGTLTNGQKNAQKRAYQMTDIAWTPKGDILGWDSGLTYKTGTTYYGLPYGQPVNASYVPWSTDLTGFINQVNNASGKMYTSYSAYNKRAPYYSTDCSAFVSWALNLPSRQTTSGIASYGTLISTTSYANIQVGDFLNNAGSHVVICTDITYDGNGNINGIEISEATVVAATKYCCQRTWYGTGFGSNTLSYFTTKYFGGGYKLYRSKTIANVGYSHVCVSPVAGDVCSACGYGTQTPTTPDTPSDGQPKFGIDVSYAQGTINWDLVAPQIDFAIIRCGYGSDMTSQDDNQWARNVAECERLGIPYGVYLFSYADTDAKAASEAQHVLRLLADHHPTLPVFYDLESSTTQACGNAAILNFTRIFCGAIEDAGYDAGVYANLNWWRNYLTSSEYDQWYRWVAQYNTSCTYTGTYCMWQNSSTYTMSGITGNTVDTDYWYGPFPNQDTPPVSGDYTVTFKVPTDYAAVPAQGVSAGQSITLPSISTKHCGYTFMGWTTSAVSATTEQPEFYYAGQSFTPTKNTTLRAVFKYYKNGNSVQGNIYYPACSSSQTGLADALSEVKAAGTNLTYRKTIAAENFVYNYSGTADQNTAMLNTLKAGMLVDPAKTANYTAYYNTTPGVCHRATTETTVAATCTTSGTKVTSCAYCGYNKTAEVAALGHKDVYTDNGNGTHTHACSRCETVLAASEACTYESGYCTLCGGAQTVGDFSGTYYIAAKRTNDTNYQYLTNTVSSDRLSIEDSGVTVLPASISSPEANKTFSIIADGSGKYTIRADGTAGTTNFIGWKQATSSADNNAILVASDSAVHADITGSAAGYVNISFTDTANTLRYLAFNSTATNRYCCWYSSQIKNLYLIPVTGSLPPHAHSYTSSVTLDPTCTTAGVRTYTCECGDTYTEPIPALQHDYIYHYVDPTCTARGYTRATCSRCDFDEILDYSYVDALGHDWNEQVPVPATCTEEGYTPLVCSRCGATDLTDIVDALGHIYDYLDNGNGTHKYWCTRCETVFDAAEECVFDDGVCIGCGHVQKTASYGDFVLVTEAPSDWSGTYLIVCNDKSAAFDGSLATPYAKTNYHTVTISDGVITGNTTVRSYAVTVEKVSGTSYYTIRLSNGKYMGSTGSSTGINASTTKYQNAISLDANGNAIIANTSGTNTYNFRFNTASTSDRFAFFATSTGKPVQLYKYIECPHSYDSGAVTTAATCEAAGVKTFTCSLCGDTYTEAIPALGHNYVYGAEQNGTVTGTCSNCGDHLYRYRVSYAVPAFATAPESALVDSGEAITALPEAETVCGYVQMGWVSAPITETNTEPTFFQKGSAYTVNAPVTLYAVYAYYKDNGELTGNIYYPACEDRYVSLYSALESVAKGTGSLTYRENSIAPAMYIYGYTGSTAQNNALLALLKNGMVIDPALVADYTKYYATAPGACLRAILTDNGNGTHTAACAHCGYTLTGAHTYEEGICACGASMQSLCISSAALVLNGKIDVIYTAYIPEGYTDARMVFTMNGETQSVTDDGTHTFIFTGVNPQCMGDTIEATLYATKNGTEESVSKNDYSVRQYCVSMLSKTTDAKLRKLLSDLLAYGACAQTYMSYKTNALVNEGSDIVNPTYSTYHSLSGLAASFDGTAASDLIWTGASLTLTDGVAMNFRFYAASTSGLSIQVTLNGRTETFTSFKSVGNGIYEISFTGINADEFADTVSASFYRSNVKTGNTVSYSVNTYVCAKQADTDTALANLVKALYGYGASAAAYSG